MLVKAWMIPIGMVKTVAMTNERMTEYQAMPVGYARAETKANAVMTAKRARYHQVGTSLYLRMIFMCTSSSSPLDDLKRRQISGPWNR